MIMVIGPHRRKSDARSEARAERATRDAQHPERPISRQRAAVRDAEAGEQPAEVQPAEAQPAEVKPAAEVQPAAPQPAEASEPVQDADTAAASTPEAGEAQPRPKPAPAARSGPARVAAASKASARS